MPPLHRMPIVYVLALIVGVGWILYPGASEPKPTPERGGLGSATSPPGEVSDATPASPPEIVVEPPRDGILRNKEGLRRKVLITALDLDPLDSPEQGRALGTPLDYFSTWFLHGVWPADAPTPSHYQIGPGQGPAVGWVPAGAVIEWDTRLLARPTPVAGRPPLVLYQEQVCAQARGGGAPCPNHGSAGCPTQGEERSSAGVKAEFPGGFPLLRIVRPARAGGPTLLEVASLVRMESKPVPPRQVPPEFLAELRQVSIAFVIDTTASMQATIDQTRRLARQLQDDVRQRYKDVTLRLALIEYRDTSPSYGYRIRLATPFVDPIGFESAVNVLQAARSGDGSIDESVLDGLAAAIPGTPQSQLTWPTGRAGELATKLIVLIGDAPDHAKDLDRTTELAHKAREAGITIAAVAVERPGALSRDEARRLKEQWSTLSLESYRPLDPSQRFQRQIEPLRASLTDLSRLVGSLDQLVAARVERARTLAALAQADAEDRLVEYVNSRGLTLSEVAPVLVDLGRQGGVPSQADPRSRGRRAPSVRRGWIVEAIDDRPLVTVELLLSKSDLLTIIEELSRLRQVAVGEVDDREELVRIGTAAALGEAAFLKADRSGESFASVLARRAELLLPQPGPLLERPEAELSQSDDATRSALRERLGKSIPALTKILVKQRWDDPRSQFPGLAIVPYRLINF